LIIETQVHARAGLLGNPSDMFGGKVISFLIRNFSARVRLWESPNLTFRMHPQHDRTEFADLWDLVHSVRRHGYYGMQRLLFATCTRFAAYCQERRLPLREATFTLEYDTDVPRQSGLGGSSAMIIATLRALLRFHRIPARKMPPDEIARLALSVETQELGIAAGLQDRVVQAYGGLTYMDLSGSRGRYQRLPSRLLPRFGLVYLNEEQMGTRESGQVHSGLRYRWEQGDRETVRAIRALARCAEAGREALRKGDLKRLGRLIDRNFDLRRGLFGDEALGAHNIAMVDIARAAGCSAKLSGSGGAVLVLLPDREVSAGLAEAYAAQGYRYAAVKGR
jgi:glucuronokinase